MHSITILLEKIVRYVLRIVAMGASVVDSVGQRRRGSGGSLDTGDVGAGVGELRCGPWVSMAYGRRWQGACCATEQEAWLRARVQT